MFTRAKEKQKIKSEKLCHREPKKRTKKQKNKKAIQMFCETGKKMLATNWSWITCWVGFNSLVWTQPCRSWSSSSGRVQIIPFFAWPVAHHHSMHLLTPMQEPRYLQVDLRFPQQQAQQVHQNCFVSAMVRRVLSHR
jgi:hypothetical protein